MGIRQKIDAPVSIRTDGNRRKRQTTFKTFFLTNKMTSIPTVDDLIAFVRDGGADVTGLRKQYTELFNLMAKAKKETAEAEAKKEEAEAKKEEAEAEAKKTAEVSAKAEAKKKAEASAEHYIKVSFNDEMLPKLADDFSENPLEGSVKMDFRRKDEWDSEKFAEVLNGILKEIEEDLNTNEGLTTFDSEVVMINDVVGADGLCNAWNVYMSWETELTNPFDDAKAK